MLLRALFSIGIVAALIPHEPNIGYGSPEDRDGVVAIVRDSVQSRIAQVGQDIRDARAGRLDRERGEDGDIIARASHAIESLAEGGRAARREGDPIGDKIAETMSRSSRQLQARLADTVSERIEKINILRADDPSP